jgi:hypothetical protein
MTTGLCRLCLQTKELRDSHFLPRGSYKPLRTPKVNPFVVNPNFQGPTSAQVRAHMLCGACEHRLNQRGEDWVLRNCWRTDTSFPLRDALDAATPVTSRPPYEAFAGASIPGVDVDKLAYFGASMFWRACLRGWRRVGGHAPLPLELGPYEEELRLFLLDKAPFPVDVVLVVGLGVSTAPVPHRGIAILPWTKLRDPVTRHYHHRFVMAGLAFELFTGHGIPSDWRALCAVRSPNRLIHRSPVVDYWNDADAKSGFAKALAGSKRRPRRPKGR